MCGHEVPGWKLAAEFELPGRARTA